MGTVAIYRNARIVIHTLDHGPPHVHAKAPNAEAVFDLTSMEALRSWGFSERSVAMIQMFLETRKKELWEAWNEIHDKK